jgi:hypothetical protein
MAQHDGRTDRPAMRGAVRPIRALWGVSLVLAVALPAYGQGEDKPTQLWLSYQHQHKVGEKTRVFSSLGYDELLSKEKFFGEWNKLYVKGGGSYDLGERFRVAVGTGLYYTYQPEVADLFEFRLWQEGTAFWPDSAGVVRRWVLTHRLRLEERFTEADGWSFAMRLRYRLDTKIPLNTYTLETGAFYVPLGFEVFADIIDEAPEFFAKRNRATIGLGYVINQKWTVDLRYHRQSSRSTIEEEFKTSTNVIDFSVRSSFRIRDLVKGR